MRRSMRWFNAMALGALIVLLAACGTSRSAASGATPEEAIERYFAKVGVSVAPAAGGLIRLSMRDSGGDIIGLYQKPGDSNAMFFQIARPGANGGYTTQIGDGGGASFTNCCVEPQPWIHFGSHPVGVSNYIVFGRRVDPRVHSVSVLFDNGAVVRDIVRDEVFAAYTKDAMGVCEVKVYDQGGALLRRTDDLARNLPLDDQARQPSCP